MRRQNLRRSLMNCMMGEMDMRKLNGLILLLAALLLGACSTVQGIGKDLEKGGEAIQKAAK
jgi:entericidin B